MASPGGPVTIAGESVTGYYGLGPEAEAFIRKLIVETSTLQPGEAADYKVNGVYYIGFSQDVGGNVLVGIRGESPINPNAQKPSDV